MTDRTEIEGDVERQLATTLPKVDLLQVAVSGSGDSAMLKVVVDHPDGVDHDLCADVTHALGEAGLRERFGIEVWSPGPERPLRTHEHYAAVIGERARIWTGTRKRPRLGHIRELFEDALVFESDGERTTIEFAEIRHGELAPEREAV